MNRYGSIEVLSGSASTSGSKWWKDVRELDLGDWENYGFFFIKEAFKDFIFSVHNPANP